MALPGAGWQLGRLAAVLCRSGSAGVFALAYIAANTLGLWQNALPPNMLARLYAMALGG